MGTRQSTRFMGICVGADILGADARPLVAPLHEIDVDWTDYLDYLRHSGAFVERVYRLEKANGFEGNGTPDAKQFTEERLAAGASMLRDLISVA